MQCRPQFRPTVPSPLLRFSGSLTDPLAAKQQQKQGGSKGSATYLADSGGRMGRSGARCCCHGATHNCLRALLC